MSSTLIGKQGGDEAPLPPDGATPHHLPIFYEGPWHNVAVGNIPDQ